MFQFARIPFTVRCDGESAIGAVEEGYAGVLGLWQDSLGGLQFTPVRIGEARVCLLYTSPSPRD